MVINGQTSLQNCVTYDDLSNLAKAIVEDLYLTIIDVNQAKINEYSRDILDTGDPTGYFYKSRQIHMERLRYAKHLRRVSAFYTRVIQTLVREIKPRG